MPAVSAACPSAGELDGGLSGGQQITATAKYTIMRCSGPVKSTNGGFRPALTALPSTSRAERKITAEFFPLRAECINTGIACYNMLDPKNSVALIMLFSGSNLSYNEEVIGLTGHCLS